MLGNLTLKGAFVSFTPPPQPPLLADAPAAARAAGHARVIGVTTLVVAAAAAVAAFWSFITGAETDGAFRSTASADLRIVMMLGRLILAGLLLWLGFYGVRLLVQTAPGATADVRPRLLDNLTKIRGILVVCMFLSIACASLALGMPPSQPRPIWGLRFTGCGNPAMQGVVAAAFYGACCAACGGAVWNVRKALAGFAEPPPTRDFHGFEVAFAATGAVPSASAVPQPVMPASATQQPAAVLPASPMPAGLSLLASGDLAYPDLRLLLNVVAIIGIIVYTIDMPRLVGNFSVAVDVVHGRGVVVNAAVVRPLGADSPVPDAVVYPLFAMTLVGGLCGAWWIVWGVITLTNRPWLRRTATVMALVTVTAAALLFLLTTYVRIGHDRSYQYPNFGSMVARNDAIRGGLTALVHPLVLLVLLTRSQVKHLFARGSEAGEG